MIVEIKLNEEDMMWCLKHAKKTYQYRESIRTQFGAGEYTHNTINGALIGIKCELASSIFLKTHFEIKDYYDSCPTVDTGDFIINGYSIEIKGLKDRDWNKYKRQIPPIQLKKYISKNAIIIWATTENHKLPRNKVFLRGWNYAHEVKEKGQFVKTICDNIWLKDDEDMHEMNGLIWVLRNEKVIE